MGSSIATVTLIAWIWVILVILGLLMVGVLPASGLVVSIDDQGESWELEFLTTADMLDGALIKLRAPSGTRCDTTIMVWHYMGFTPQNLSFSTLVRDPGCEAQVPGDGSPRTAFFWLLLEGDPDRLVDAGGGIPWTLELMDLLEPVISYTHPAGKELTVGDADGERIRVLAADSSGDITVVLDYLEPGTAAFGVEPYSITMESVGQNYYQARLPGTRDVGDYRYRIRANDSNTARVVSLPGTGWFSFPVVDLVPPEITMLSIPDQVDVEESFTIEFSVVDQGRLESVRFDLRQTFEARATRYTDVQVDDQGRVIIPVEAQGRQGTLDLTIVATDAARNSFNSQVYSVEVRDTVAPVISDLEVNHPWTGGRLELRFNVTDNIGVQIVEVDFQQGDEGRVKYVAIPQGSDAFYWQSPELTGDEYRYLIIARDANGVSTTWPGQLAGDVIGVPGKVPWGALAAIVTLLLGLVALVKGLHYRLPRRGA